MDRDKMNSEMSATLPDLRGRGGEGFGLRVEEGGGRGSRRERDGGGGGRVPESQRSSLVRRPIAATSA